MDIWLIVQYRRTLVSVRSLPKTLSNFSSELHLAGSAGSAGGCCEYSNTVLARPAQRWVGLPGQFKSFMCCAHSTRCVAEHSLKFVLLCCVLCIVGCAVLPGGASVRRPLAPWSHCSGEDGCVVLHSLQAV